MSPRGAVVAGCVVLAVGLAGCGGSAAHRPAATRAHGRISLEDKVVQLRPTHAQAEAVLREFARQWHRPDARIRMSLTPRTAGKVITIDPGHNGRNYADPTYINHLVPDGDGEKGCDTTGTQAPDGFTEAEFNWLVALDLQQDLRREGATVVLTRHSNDGVGPCVNVRAAIGNRAHSAAAISIHADGGPPDGSGFAVLEPAPIPTHYDQRIIAPSHRLVLDLRGTLESVAHLHPSTYDGVDGIAPRTDLGGLNLSLVPKVFVEVGNMQNARDEAPMQTTSYRRRVAAALAAGLTAFVTHR